MSERAVVVRLRAEVGNFQRDMQQAAAAARTAGTATEQAGVQSQRGATGLLASAAANEQAWSTVGKGLLGVGAAVTAGVGLSIAKFAEFDKAMSSVNAATHETSGNMDLLRDAAIRVGADTAFSAVEAAQGIEELAKAGVSTQDILNGGLVGAMDLAAAGALGVGEASELAATAMTQFKLSGSDLPHVADLLAAGAGKAQGSVQDMGAALKQSGLVASQVGLTIEETTGGLAAFASAGLIGSDAGTSFKSMLQRLTPQSKEAQKAMDSLGISAYDAGGDFIGLEAFAGNLQESMKGLTVEQRNAAMGTIFGSDAVRAASVIYENGADGVAKWMDSVNDAGYAAETAARMSDNLAGDIEKLGGSFDTLMIKSGSGPSEMLRGIVQAAEGAVDAVGKVPGPVLTSITVAASLVGGLLLLGGAFITIIPKIAATRAAMAGFNASSAGVVAGMKKIGIAGGLAAVAIVGLGIASAAASKDSTYNVESIEGKLIQLAKTGGSTKTVFGTDFFKDASESSDPFAKSIESVGQALRDLDDVSGFESFNEGSAGFLNGIFGGKMTTQVMETKKAIQGMSDGLAVMVQNGDGAEAALAFSKIAEDGKRAGVEVATTAGHFNTYETALRKQANTLKVNLTDEEYHQWMLGNVPPLIDAAAASAEGQTAAAEAMAAANEETAQRLADVGLAADGTVQSLGKLLEAMFATGLAQLSANEASIKWQESLEGLDASINKYGTSLDITTEAGKANSRALDGMAQAGISNMEAMANNGATQKELQGTMRGTYDSLVAAAGRFGKTAEEADAYARKVLGIPDDANVDTAIHNYADTMAKLNGIKSEADALDGKIATVKVQTFFEQYGIPYADKPDTTYKSNVPWAGGYTGGSVDDIMGMWTGGVIPGTPPADKRHDNILAMVGGKPLKVQSGEYIVNGAATRANLPLLTAINDGTYQAPSKSIASGYAPTPSVSAYSGGTGATPVVNLTAIVENPWTGEQVTAKVISISEKVADHAAVNMIRKADGLSAYSRIGRR